MTNKKEKTIREVALTLAKRKMGVTSTDIEIKTGTSRSTASAALTELSNMGYLRTTGSFRNSRYGRKQSVYATLSVA